MTTFKGMIFQHHKRYVFYNQKNQVMKKRIFNEDELYIQFGNTTGTTGKINGISVEVQHDNDSVIGIISLEAALDILEQLTSIISKLK